MLLSTPNGNLKPRWRISQNASLKGLSTPNGNLKPKRLKDLNGQIYNFLPLMGT